MVGDAIDHWNGQTAFTMGVSHASDDGRVVFKAAGSVNSRGNAGGNVGAGISF